MKIAMATYDKQEKFDQGLTTDEDADLLAFLTRKGLHVVAAIWNDPSVDWGSFDGVVIKSTWDYHNHLDAFMAWIDRLEKLGVTVLNPPETLRWNSHKKYLKEMANNGLPVIATEYLASGSAFDERFFDLFGTDQLVVKPCISAGAQNTITVGKANFHEQANQINGLLQTADYIVQPFVEEIKSGEWSFLFFNGKYSHCVLKTPKAGDFRVQHYHGGRISYPTPTAQHIAQAGAYLDSLPSATLYARVDGVVIDDAFRLMELELIEPYLFLNAHERLLENYYEALVLSMKR